MNPMRSIPVAILLAAAAQAQGILQISIGIRETDASAGTFTNIGGNGGTVGGIEFVAQDQQTLVLDGTWQQFTFNIATDPLVGFAGTTANGILDGTFGVLEHVRILNSGGVTDPISLWIDDIVDTTATLGPVTVSDFEGYSSGSEVTFQEPPFSGSTSTHVLPSGTSGIANHIASRSSSCRCNFQFVDGTTTRWVRLTTFGALSLPNPSIRFDDQSVVTFWMRGGVAGEDLGSQGPGTSVAEIIGTGLNAGQSSFYYTSGTAPISIGLMGISWYGRPDFPLYGGNLVSGTGLVKALMVFSDINGRTQLPLVPFGAQLDFVLQTAFLDPAQPQGFSFTNAVRAHFGP